MFDETKLYMANDPALDVLGTPSSSAAASPTRART